MLIVVGVDRPEGHPRLREFTGIRPRHGDLETSDPDDRCAEGRGDRLGLRFTGSRCALGPDDRDDVVGDPPARTAGGPCERDRAQGPGRRAAGEDGIAGGPDPRIAGAPALVDDDGPSLELESGRFGQFGAGPGADCDEDEIGFEGIDSFDEDARALPGFFDSGDSGGFDHFEPEPFEFVEDEGGELFFDGGKDMVRPLDEGDLHSGDREGFSRFESDEARADDDGAPAALRDSRHLDGIGDRSQRPHLRKADSGNGELDSARAGREEEGVV